MGFYGMPRATGDIDIWIKPSEVNAKNLLLVIKEFFGTDFDYTAADLLDDETIQFGVQPVRIDLIKTLSGVSNEELWNTKIKGRFADYDVYFISRELFIKNKKASGRRKDLFDAETLLDFDAKNSIK